MKRDNRSLTDRVKALGEPPADAVYSTILDQSESLLLDVNVSPDLIAQIVEQWIDRDQQKVAIDESYGLAAEPGFIGFYRHVDGGIIDTTPASMVGNSTEARFLDEVISAAGQEGRGSNRGTVQAKLS